jgi:signal transduction histidine kinase/CheY-like chemotaxis protein
MKNIKDFIYREFFLKQVIWLMASLTLLFTVVNVVQIGYGIRATKDKINTMLELNQSEIFSSIVLQDYQSLKDHLELIKKQYQFDWVEIEAKGEIVSSGKDKLPYFFKWITLFHPQFNEVIKNEFETVGFKFSADFSNLTINDYFLPYLRLSFWMFLSLLVVIYLFFKKQIGLVQKDIIKPLTVLVEKLQNDELDEDVKSFSLIELDILSKAIKSYPQLKKDSVIAEITSQVAHDIRSPLEALKSAKDEIAKLPEEERVSINLAVSRIEEIAYNLLMMRKKSTRKTLDHTQIKSTLNQVIQEKKMQYRHHEKLTFKLISDERDFALFSGIKAETFKRIISNILSNAVEAMNFGGEVEVLIYRKDTQILIDIIDQGGPVSSEHLDKMFTKGFTTKSDGNGLGLYNAKKEIEAIGGTISIMSKDKTTLSLVLPACEPPSFFTSEINLSSIDRVIILDDDESIHRVWRKRFRGLGVELEHFYKAKNLLDQYNEIPCNYLLLSDYELLGEELTGVDCINRLHSTHNSILVTARADEPSIVKSCEQFNIRLLPKSLANDIRLLTLKLQKRAVLIDDDKMTHLSWKLTAKKAEIELQAFSSVKEFIDSSSSFERHTPIYIDSDLGLGLKGEVLSEEVFNLGFKELFLATGHSESLINKPAWIKDILGKSPPFRK